VLDPASGKMVVDAASFQFVEGVRPGFFDIFLALQRGYVDASNILFLIVFAYGYVYMLIDNGTLNNSINMLIRALGEKTYLIIPVCMLALGLLGSTMGIYEEVYGLIPVFIGISIALGYDVIVGGAIVFIGVATGFAAATTNPFSIGIAQSIAEVPMFSGLGFRIITFIVFESVSIAYVMHYAKKVKKDPTKSILYGEKNEAFQEEFSKDTVFTFRQKICLLLFFVTIGMLLYGTTQLGWYINELAAMFLMMMIFTGLIGGYSTTKICKTFIKSTQNIVSSILVIGFTRGILLIMQDAKISDTIVFYLSQLLYGHSKYFSAVGMLALQNVINFFITGSSSQATITMPIMAPVADIVGISRQTAVLAYHFGDGFSNMFWPTACALECGLMNIPINKWYKFMAPLFGIMLILQVVFTMLSVVVFV
ncbi:MAG: TIGR00366 family protein, partial [Oscillospiraceae bacterium]